MFLVLVAALLSIPLVGTLIAAPLWFAATHFRILYTAAVLLLLGFLLFRRSRRRK